MKFSKRTDWNSAPNPITEKMRLLQAQGAKILDLTVSNPTRCGFQTLSPELLQAFQHPQNIVYEPDAHGLLAFREKLCRHYAGQNIHLRPEQIFLTANTSEAYSYLFRLLMESGDTLLAPAPSYPLLEFLAPIQDVELVRYPLAVENGWEPDWDACENRASLPKAILTVHPNNPTGNFMPDTGRAQMIEWARKWNAAIISDEVFFDYPWDSLPRRSFASVNEVLTFTLGGLSKFLALPQMKLSWMIITGPEALVEAARSRIEILADTFLSVSTPVQYAALQWWEMKNQVQNEIRQRLCRNYAFLKKELHGADVYRVLAGEGGWNAVLQLPENRSAEDEVLTLLEQKHVFVHPGYLFDFQEDRYLIVSLLLEENLFREGIKRLKS